MQKYEVISMVPHDYPVICDDVDSLKFFQGMPKHEKERWSNAKLNHTIREKRSLEKEVYALRLKMRRMEHELDRIKDNQANIILFDMPVMPDIEAEVLIRDYLESLKDAELKRVSLMDIMTELNLPPDQIERVMEKLEDEGVRPIG